jgi:hypothetical protein
MMNHGDAHARHMQRSHTLLQRVHRMDIPLDDYRRHQPRLYPLDMPLRFSGWRCTGLSH